ncbi:four-carbon acid sugar kinase family protein [Orbus sturtevantii]|uniref:four-carbon acid sugar kinase family protein n=1 Tax=Orbus sturtevantii TaxID=3074109 RepID=UPI00370D34A7
MKVAVVADDLTGANATSALLSKKGFKAITCLEKFHDDLVEFEIISFATDSRSIPYKEAYSRVVDCIEQFKKYKPLISKRIDSTLRGNLGAEVDAVIDHNPDLMALVVPVYPSSDRICVGGSLLVNGIPLQNTAMRNDPKNPMTESSILELFHCQSRYPITHVPLKEVLEGQQRIEKKLKQIYQQGGRVVIFDATTDIDINVIAQAAENTKLPVFCVDPGPFTAQFAHLRYSSERTMANKVFIAIGSVSDLTQRQIKKLKYDRKIWLETIAVQQLIDIARDSKNAKPIVDKLLVKLAQFDLIGLDTVETPADVCDLGRIAEKNNMTITEASSSLNKGIAEITGQVLLNPNSPIRALYTSGGDVTVSVVNRVGSSGFLLKDEVEPLAVYGHLVGGKCNGYAIVTKGGFVGNDNTLVHCIDYLTTKVSSYESPSITI